MLPRYSPPRNGQELGGTRAAHPTTAVGIVVIVVVVTMTVVTEVVATMPIVVPVLLLLDASLVSAFRVQQLLEFATVEKDPAHSAQWTIKMPGPAIWPSPFDYGA